MMDLRFLYIVVMSGSVQGCISDADAKDIFERLNYLSGELEKVRNDNIQLKEYIANTNPMLNRSGDSKWIIEKDDNPSKDQTPETMKLQAKCLLVTSPSDSEVIAFTVALSYRIQLGEKQTVEYDQIILNLGNGYDSRHGHFTAPRRGLYSFSVTMFNLHSDTLALEFVRNGNRIVDLYAEGNHYTPHSQTVLLTLQQGDMVWIRLKPAYNSKTLFGSADEFFNTFSGVMLFSLQ